MEELPLHMWTAHGRTNLFKVYKDLRSSAKYILIPSLTKGRMKMNGEIMDSIENAVSDNFSCEADLERLSCYCS